MNCIECSSIFKPFVHNQRRCGPCVDKKLIKEGSLSKKARRKFHKNCEWCNNLFRMTGPAARYCSRKCAMDFKRASKYNLNFEEYTVLFNKTVCDICHTDGFIMDASKYNSGLVIDHCHSTGKVRGLLCHNCNRALGLFQDNITMLNDAIKYLERATTIPSGSTPKQVEAHNT
jgi:hypothetical protein